MARQQELAPIYGSNGKKKDGISVGFLWDFYGIWDSKSGSDEDWRYLPDSKTYFPMPKFQRISPQSMAKHMVQSRTKPSIGS